MRHFKLTIFILFSFFLISSNANALLISGPIDYKTSGLVGTADIGTMGVNVGNEAVWADNILGLGVNDTANIGGYDYKSHETDDYTGTIDYLLTGDFLKDEDGSDGWDIGAGWEYVMAKYDGQNAGFVLYYLGGEAASIPEFSDNIWTNITPSGEVNGYQLSHWTAFNATSVPEPSIIFLMAVGLIGMGYSSRKKSRV